jgi:hypothetical protein
MSRSISFTLSIDTEEDNWTPAREGITTTNIRRVPSFNERFQRRGVRPTYFVSYQVAVCPEATGVMRTVHGGGGAEIGAHLHPWNTPPETGLEDRVTMLMNYPPDAQEAKVHALVAAIEENIGVRPLTFRAGRFGFAASTVPALSRNGLNVDSSVTPLVTWEAYDDGPSFLEAPLNIYRFDPEDPLRPGGPDSAMLEVPISIGATRFAPDTWPRLARLRQNRVVRALRLNGIASRLNLLRWVIMSPETNSAADMIRASRQLVDGGATHLHMFMHSNSLAPGMGPFASTEGEVDQLLGRIDAYLDGISRHADLVFQTVAEVAARHTAVSV